MSDDSWTEGALTYNTRKALGTTTIGSLAAPSSISSSYSITLTPSALQGDVGSTLSLGLTTTSSDGLGLGTREAAAGATPAADLQVTSPRRAALVAATVMALAAVPGTASARPVPTQARAGPSVGLAPAAGAAVTGGCRSRWSCRCGAGRQLAAARWASRPVRWWSA